jgi:hypothetical protein
MDKDLRGKAQPASSRLDDQDSTGSEKSSGTSGIRDEWLDEGTKPGESILDGMDMDDEGLKKEEHDNE